MSIVKCVLRRKCKGTFNLIMPTGHVMHQQV